VPSEAIQYVNNLPAISYGANVDVQPLQCEFCDAKYHVHYSNSESPYLLDKRYLAKQRITAQHPEHERSILL
jgi:hypothetical protein